MGNSVLAVKKSSSVETVRQTALPCAPKPACLESSKSSCTQPRSSPFPTGELFWKLLGNASQQSSITHSIYLRLIWSYSDMRLPYGCTRLFEIRGRHKACDSTCCSCGETLSLIFMSWDWPRLDGFSEHATHLKCRVAFNAWNIDAAKIFGSPKIRPSQKPHFL